MCGLEERGGNYIGIEPLTGRTIPNVNIRAEIAENSHLRTVVRISGTIAEILVVQRLILYRGLKRFDVENEVHWTQPRLVRLQQLFPLTYERAQVRYGVPFGSNEWDGVIRNAAPHAKDEVSHETWIRSRDIQNWLWAGGPDWGVTIAADHHQLKLVDGVIRAEMVRGTRFTSVRVVRGDQVGSLNYPPTGKYVFRYSVSSGLGDWKATKAWRIGMDFNNALIPVSVVDEISSKSLPPSQSFCSVQGENLVISAFKKADLEDKLVLRVYEMEGRPVETPVVVLHEPRKVRELNLLEETMNPPQRALRVQPYQIMTIAVDHPQRSKQ